jgi:hypothetical protein
VQWWHVVEALSHQSFKQLEVGARWRLPGELGAALGDDVLDSRKAVPSLVRGEQAFQQVSVRIGTHDRIVVLAAELPTEGSRYETAFVR